MNRHPNMENSEDMDAIDGGWSAEVQVYDSNNFQSPPASMENEMNTDDNEPESEYEQKFREAILYSNRNPILAVRSKSSSSGHRSNQSSPYFNISNDSSGFSPSTGSGFRISQNATIGSMSNLFDFEATSSVNVHNSWAPGSYTSTPVRSNTSTSDSNRNADKKKRNYDGQFKFEDDWGDYIDENNELSGKQARIN